MAFGQASLVEEVLGGGPLQRVTPTTVVMPGVLLDQLRRVRTDGYATEIEETTAGYGSVAVPIFGASGMLLASLSLTTPVVRSDVARHAAALRTVSQKVAAGHAIN